MEYVALSAFVVAHPTMWGMLVVAVLLLVYEWGQQYRHLHRLGISPHAAVKLINERAAQVVAVTQHDPDPHHRDIGIVGTVYITLATLQSEETDSQALIALDRPVILVGDMPVIEAALDALLARGCRERYYLSGGVASWQSAGLPLCAFPGTQQAQEKTEIDSGGVAR